MQIIRDVTWFARKHWRDVLEGVGVLLCAAVFWGGLAAGMFYGTRLFFAAMVWLGEQSWQ
jgi:hypothetical protein